MVLNRTYDQQPHDKDQGPTVLCIDDQELDRATLRSACSDALNERAFRLLECSNIPDAIRVLSETQVHVVLLDKNLGPNESNQDQNGILNIERFLSIQPHLQILMVTGSDSTQDIVVAMKNGAFGYVVKNSPSELLIEQIKNAVRYALMSQQNNRSTRSGSQKRDLVGDSTAIRLLRRQVEALSKTETPVLLTGETGTGKTVVAELLHSLRQIYLKQEKRPFVHLNMGAIPEEIAERELFGSERGAFTGAIQKLGSVEEANGGTLFLDEIGNASLDMQMKLLTVLDSGQFKRLGSNLVKKSAFRLICATNENLEALVREGRFREDLFMRISTMAVRVPSISERLEDIPYIVQAILPKCCDLAKVFVSYEQIPADFIEYLKNTPIRGNMRGIEQQIIRLLVLAPRDSRNRLLLKEWKSLDGFRPVRRPVRSVTGPITFDELIERDLDVVGAEGFKGLHEFETLIRRKLVLDSTRKYSGVRKQAEALDVSPSMISTTLTEMGLARRQTASGLSTTQSSIRKDRAV